LITGTKLGFVHEEQNFGCLELYISFFLSNERKKVPNFLISEHGYQVTLEGSILASSMLFDAR
jgi:hypothetical protein